ncbi:hypothetical protein KIN20_012402 [Parelaphostrongylus tenuis]|uniref:Uncharacterized protein n=1 Tax=Parelaphostrongylus tenuis TaxID=148309 RepID=A0AAD5QLR3_PARTN|nr:hypothetical protein KIN20_012402 [Parelaphostrongylus tenuis]
MTVQSGGIGGPPNIGVLGPMGSGIPSSQIGPEFGTSNPFFVMKTLVRNVG